MTRRGWLKGVRRHDHGTDVVCGGRAIIFPTSYLSPKLRLEEVTQLSRADMAAASCFPSVAASTAAPSAATRNRVARRGRGLVEDAPGRNSPAEGIEMEVRTDAIGGWGLLLFLSGHKRQSLIANVCDDLFYSFILSERSEFIKL